METAVQLAVIGLLLTALWWGVQPAAIFVVRLRDGLPQPVKGTVTPAFLDAVREVCQQCGVQAGTVKGLARGRRISLAFSRRLPPEARQRLRNWWAISGWPAPAPRR